MLSRTEQLDLADLAIRLARQMGADYADVRIGRTWTEYLLAREHRLEECNQQSELGLGLRILLKHSWGFAASQRPDRDAVSRCVDRAIDNARAVCPIQARAIVLEEIPVHEAEWIMPLGIDPFSVSADIKAEKLIAINAAALGAGADFCTSSFLFTRDERLFASSRGSRIFQARTRSFPSFEVTAVDRQSGAFASRASLAPARAAGFDYVISCDLVAEAALATEQARQKLRAQSVRPGQYDLVIDPTNLWLTIHETVGHSTELDRVLGWEANFAGTSFVKPEGLNRLRFGSPLMTILADRSQDGGLASVAFDDDGVGCAAAEFPIIENGILRNFQMALGQAGSIGLERSNGCAYAARPTDFPIQRMPNISLKPNPSPCSLNELFAGVDHGLYIVGSGSWSIDQQRDNFQFSGQLFYEIKNGRLGQMLRDVAYQGRTLDFWNAMDGLGDASTYFLGGSFYCGKGEPVQLAPVSHGAVPARFRGATVLNTASQDI